MSAQLKKRNSGITLVEILVVLAVLVVLISFAAPSVSGATAAMELRAAAANVEHSIDMARQTARRTESEVTLNVVGDSESGQQKLTLTLSDRARKRLAVAEMPEFLLDEGLAFVSEQQSYTFDGRGIVENPGHLMVIVSEDDSHNTGFIIE